MKNDYVRLIISDLHLGSAYSEEKALESFLKTAEFDELILAGDILEFWKKPNFTETTSRLMNYLSNL